MARGSSKPRSLLTRGTTLRRHILQEKSYILLMLVDSDQQYLLRRDAELLVNFHEPVLTATAVQALTVLAYLVDQKIRTHRPPIV